MGVFYFVPVCRDDILSASQTRALSFRFVVVVVVVVLLFAGTTCYPCLRERRFLLLSQFVGTTCDPCLRQDRFLFCPNLAVQ